MRAKGSADPRRTDRRPGADPLFAFGCIWNMDGTGAANAHVLTGAMLANFQYALAGW